MDNQAMKEDRKWEWRTVDVFFLVVFAFLVGFVACTITDAWLQSR
jgi:hypothetical protein